MADEIVDEAAKAEKRALSNERVKAWRLANPERWKEIAAKTLAKNRERIRERKKTYGPEWVAANPDKVKAKMDKWREANREAAREATRKWRASHPDRALAAVNRWSANNVERVRATKASRRAREINAEGSFGSADVQELFKRQRGKCVYCAISIRSYFHVDHIIPLARGGTNWPSNIQLTCPPCNNKKHAKDPIAFAQENGLLI